MTPAGWDDASEPDGVTVLAAAQAGDERAWTHLFGELAGPVTGYLRLRGAAEPEDLTSEVFLRVARGIHGFAGSDAQFRSWVFTIAHHLVLDERRALARRPQVEAGSSVDGASGAPATPGADETAIDRLELERVATMLQDLTPDQRDVVLLRVLGELSLQQVADILGKETNAVKQLQHRAVAALRRRVEQDGG